MSLPSSFEKNTFERMLHFVNESNRIEDIEPINCNKDEGFKISGHFEALIASQVSASNREPLSLRKIEHWQNLLKKDQSTPLAPGKELKENALGSADEANVSEIKELIAYINTALDYPDQLQDDLEYCVFLATVLQRFESLNLSIECRGKVARLLANYIATYCGRPIVIFNSDEEEKNQYSRACQSPRNMAYFIAQKIQEAIFGLNGTILFKKAESSPGATCCYQSAQGEYKEYYEWHALILGLPARLANE
jgi:hypothetical protein